MGIANVNGKCDYFQHSLWRFICTSEKLWDFAEETNILSAIGPEITPRNLIETVFPTPDKMLFTDRSD